MKKILVPCDFSKPAINAFRFALDVAEQSKGTVYLIHVVELPVLHDSILMPVLNFEAELLKELRDKAEREFLRIIDKYKVDCVNVNFKVVFGLPSKMIIDFAHDQEIDLIIVGSHGASGLRELFIGSNAEKIVRNAAVPVLVIKNYFKGTIKNIVFPNSLDLDNQEELVKKVKALQSFFKAQLHIVWINTPLNFASDTITLERLRAFAKRHMFRDYSINIFNHPNEENGILEFTKFTKGDLIAIGTHGRKGIAHMINGSMAEDVVNHADRLIWTYSMNKELIEA